MQCRASDPVSAALLDDHGDAAIGVTADGGFTVGGSLLSGQAPLNPRQLLLVNLLTFAMGALGDGCAANSDSPAPDVRCTWEV